MHSGHSLLVSGQHPLDRRPTHAAVVPGVDSLVTGDQIAVTHCEKTQHQRDILNVDQSVAFASHVPPPLQ